ncbi:MAG: excinuclease ABC subunit UvrC [Candidatus Nanopelagicales bacterium]|nr:excinuclease ABC subunit UvrC [Candidatus Nanopelagicales bacterium]
MAPTSLRPEPGSVPDSPGVYRFTDSDGRILYVGKAKSLRGRLNSYFADPDRMHPRTRAMLSAASGLEWVVVGSEAEALQLEYSWIKAFEPRFNVKYTDDKSYPYLAVTVGEEYPRIMVMRGAKRKGVRYFGPYAYAWAIRETVDQLLRVFPARTCGKGVFRGAAAAGRPCLLGDIGKCSAPCVGRVSAEDHRAIVDDFCSFMAGDSDKYVRGVERRMKAASRRQDYETAARMRDDLAALRKALERNAVVLPDRTDADVVALVGDALEAAVQTFFVRKGRVTGQRGMIFERGIAMDSPELLEQALVRVYSESDPRDIPRELLVSEVPSNLEALRSWLSERRGGRVSIRRPVRGDKRALIETVTRNAEQSLTLHKRRRIGDLTTRARALEDLQMALGMSSAPLRIEGYDISTLQGQDTVGSMVVFEDGLPKKADYRRFVVSGANAHSDVDALAEVLTRRFARYQEASGRVESDPVEGKAPEDPKRRRGFSYPPQLVMVDGGSPQANSAREALDRLGIGDVAVCGLAKRLEEIWLPGNPSPLILPRSSDALHLLQQLRDEAHRFAVAGHRRRRAKRATASELDDVPGLGPARRKALLARFRSVRAIRGADLDQLTEVPGIGPVMAATIKSQLSGSPVVVSLSTGQIVEGDR